MKTKTILLLAVALLAAPLAQAEKIALTVAQVAELAQGLAGLDGYVKTVGTGEATKTVPAAYDFGPQTRWAIAENLAEAKRVLAIFDAAKSAVLKAVSPDGTGEAVDKDPKLSARFSADVRKLLDERKDLELSPIALADLRLETNAIPGSVLANLRPIVRK